MEEKNLKKLVFSYFGEKYSSEGDELRANSEEV